MTRTTLLVAVFLALGLACLAGVIRLYFLARRRHRVFYDLRAFFAWGVIVLAMGLAALSIRAFWSADIFLAVIVAAQIATAKWIGHADTRDEMAQFRRSLDARTLTREP